MKTRATVTAVCCALALLFVAPAAGHAKRGMPDYVVEQSYGVGNIGPDVLIAVATNYGSTYRVADVIATVLAAQGCEVDLRFAKDITDTDLADYDAVILGSCIYVEAWHDDALAFLEDNQDTLAALPLFYYCVCGLLGMNFDGKEDLVEEHYLQPMYGLYDLTPLDVTAFAGSVDYKILKPGDWMLLRLMFMPRGNWTDYAEVVAWAYEISTMLE